MKRTLKVVFDEISDFTNSYGTFYGVSGLFDDESLVKANKKSRAEAQELRDTLLQLIDIECDYYCDDDGQASTGRQKWKLKAILDAEGGAIYGKPPQNVGGGVSKGPEPHRESPRSVPTVAGDASLRSPTSNKDDEIRAAVALKAAVEWKSANDLALDVPDVLAVADQFDAWLKSKSSASVQSSVALSAPRPDAPAEAGTSSAGVGFGEGPAPAGTTRKFSDTEENPWAGMDVT